MINKGLAEKILDLEKQVTDLKSKKSIEDIILNSDYKVLSWFGESDGTTLNQNFDNAIIKDKKMLIKSFKIVPYAQAESDLFFNRTAGDHFTVPGLGRLTNVFDITTGTEIRIIINGANIGMFPIDPAQDQFYPLDLFIDNVYYHYRNFIDTMNIQVDGEIFIDLDVGTTGVPFIKVIIECYLY